MHLSELFALLSQLFIMPFKKRACILNSLLLCICSFSLFSHSSFLSPSLLLSFFFFLLSYSGAAEFFHVCCSPISVFLPIYRIYSFSSSFCSLIACLFCCLLSFTIFLFFVNLTSPRLLHLIFTIYTRIYTATAFGNTCTF